MRKISARFPVKNLTNCYLGKLRMKLVKENVVLKELIKEDIIANNVKNKHFKLERGQRASS